MVLFVFENTRYSPVSDTLLPSLKCIWCSLIQLNLTICYFLKEVKIIWWRMIPGSGRFFGCTLEGCFLHDLNMNKVLDHADTSDVYVTLIRFAILIHNSVVDIESYIKNN